MIVISSFPLSRSRQNVQTRRVFIRSQEACELRFLQDQPFGESPGTPAPLILEINTRDARARMAERLPEHGKIIAIRRQSHDVFHTDPVGIAATELIGDPQRPAPARPVRVLDWQQRPQLQSAGMQPRDLRGYDELLGSAGAA